MKSNASIALRGLNHSYGTLKLFSNFNFNLDSGIHQIKGQNGSGKSTLLRICGGAEKLQKGNLSICGLPAGWRSLKVNRIRSYVPDHPTFFENTKVSELVNIVSGLRVSNLNERIKEIEHVWDLKEIKNLPWNALSLGQKKRVFLSMNLLHEVPVWILDEPTNGLDSKWLEVLKNVILKHIENEGLILLSCHDSEYLRSFKCKDFYYSWRFKVTTKVDIDFLQPFIFPEGFQYGERRLAKKNVESFDVKTQFNLLGVPFDTGAGFARGAAFGPNELRKLINSPYSDLGDIKIIPQLTHDSLLNEKSINDLRRFFYSNTSELSGPVSPLSVLHEFSKRYFTRFGTKYPLLTLGGDHSITYPIIKGITDSGCIKPEEITIIHFDAHSDLFSSHLGIEHCFATWAYHAKKLLTNNGSFIQIGLHTGKKEKKYFEEKYGVKQFWSEEVKRDGVNSVLQEIFKQININGTKWIYISLDVDCTDASEFSSCGTPEYGGLPSETILNLLNGLKNYPCLGADIVEYSPFGNPFIVQDKKRDQKIVTSYLQSLINILGKNYD